METKNPDSKIFITKVNPNSTIRINFIPKDHDKIEAYHSDQTPATRIKLFQSELDKHFEIPHTADWKEGDEVVVLVNYFPEAAS